MRRSFVTLILTAALLAGCASQPAAQVPSAEAGASPAAPPSRPTAAPTLQPPATPATTAQSATGPERETMTRFSIAIADWNKAATPVTADMNDPALDIEHTGDRTASNRVKMRDSLAAMHAAVAAGADATFVAAIQEMIGSYADKMTGIDGLIDAVTKSDPTAGEAALAQWQTGINRQREALPAFFEAARPYLTPAEISAWERILAGS